MAEIDAQAVAGCSLRLRHCQRELLDPLAPPVTLGAPEPKVVPEYP
jgi:hypothetical protein